MLTWCTVLKNVSPAMKVGRRKMRGRLQVGMRVWQIQGGSGEGCVC